MSGAIMKDGRAGFISAGFFQFVKYKISGHPYKRLD